MLSCASVYFAIRKLILLFSYSFYVPCIILSNVYFYIVSSMFPFLFNRSQSKASVINQMSHFFLKLKSIFCSFQLFENCHTQNVVSTLINVVKLDFQNNNIVSALSNVVNTNVEIDNVNLTLFTVANFNVYIRNVVLMLIRYSPTSRRSDKAEMFSELLKNVAKILHNFVKFIKLKTYMFSRIPLNCCFRRLSKPY